MNRCTIQCNKAHTDCPICGRLNVYCWSHQEQVHQCSCQSQEREYPVEPQYQIETNLETAPDGSIYKSR